MSANEEQVETIRKRLGWRASRRGIKEMDIIVGGYANAKLPTMTPQQLAEFEVMLEIPDQLLLSWLTGQETVPVAQRSDMLMAMLAFRPERLKP